MKRIRIIVAACIGYVLCVFVFGFFINSEARQKGKGNDSYQNSVSVVDPYDPPIPDPPFPPPPPK